MPNQHSPRARYKRAHYDRIDTMPLNPLIPGRWLLRLYEMTPANSIPCKYENDGEDHLPEDLCHGRLCKGNKGQDTYAGPMAYSASHLGVNPAEWWRWYS